MVSYQGENKIAGYFSVSGSKSFVVKTKGNEISKNMKRRFNKFGTYDAVLKQYHIEWIWYLSKEMSYLIFFAAGIFAIDQLFKHAIDEEPK